MEPPDEPAERRDFALNVEQRLALEELLAALRDPTGQTRLLHGVTGSGKTVVYLELARRCLEAGRSVILLAPGVALALQLRREVRAFFPERETLFHHGYQSVARRARNYLDAVRAGERGQPVLAVGTRSALFLPVRDPGLIVLDEEHDASFKQEERLNYQAKEVGWFLTQESGGLLVLGSATPDVKTFHAAAYPACGGAPARDRVPGRSGHHHAQPTRLRAPDVLPGLRRGRGLS